MISDATIYSCVVSCHLSAFHFVEEILSFRKTIPSISRLMSRVRFASFISSSILHCEPLAPTEQTSSNERGMSSKASSFCDLESHIKNSESSSKLERFISSLVKNFDEVLLNTALIYLCRLRFSRNSRGQHDTSYRLFLAVFN
jgi:hypothetical protein